METQKIRSLEDLDVPEYIKDLTNVVNHKLVIRSLDQVESYLRQHLDVMEREKANGKPLGPTVWFLYSQILKDLIAHKQILEARMEYPEYFWTYKNVR